MSRDSEPAAAPAPAPPAPTVFISYASEDRAAARVLRETLTAAGLEVWYDEEELAGGDAWDQKIRRQIRDCEYFMPIISATTEVRKEGYFRREWRLATERSLDMADDVMFLLPVAIDDTAELGARVPEKFLTVQWLRLPGGRATPALHHLIRRLLAGEHHLRSYPPTGLTRAPFQRTNPPPFATPPPEAAPPPTGSPSPGDAPPPMPPFPHAPEKSDFFHKTRFVAEVLWWALTAAWMLFNRAPRWARILIVIWLILTLMSFSCSRNSVDGPPRVKRGGEKKVVEDVAEQVVQAARAAREQGGTIDLVRLGGEIADALAQEGPGPSAVGRPLLLVPFARLASEEPGDKFASAVFVALYGRLTLTHGREVGLLRLPRNGAELPPTSRAKELGATFVLTGRLAGEGEARSLAVSLLTAADAGVAWTGSFVVAGGEPSEIADQIADQIAARLPRREGREGRDGRDGRDGPKRG